MKNDKKEYTYDQVLNSVAAYCARSEKSESEVREKIRSYGLTDADIQRMTDYLRRERYVDDSRFARAYVADKFRFNRWGKRKIAMMLHSKGVDRTIAAEAIATIDDDLYRETLLTLLSEKASSIRDTDDYRRRTKLFAFAAQRGFEPQIISSVIGLLPSDEE